MPIKKKGDKWYWGSKGPFDSRKKAEDVAQAAYSSGYDERKMVNSPVGASDEGQRAPSAGEIARNERLRKEDGGGEGSDNSGAGTVFTSADVHTTTYGDNKKRRHAAGPPRVDRFLDNGTPKIFVSKDISALEEFIDKSAFTSDNFESQNRMNNHKRLDWKKKRDDTEHSVAHNHLPEGQFYKEDPPAVVERSKNNQDKEKWSQYTLAHQDDMEKKIRGYDKESKKKHGDADEPPAHQMGGSAGQIDYSGLNKQEGYGPAGQNDDLHRTGDKDQIPRRRNDDNEEEEDDVDKKIIKAFMTRHQTIFEDTFIFKDLPADELS